MKKILTLMSIFLASILLTGCISIPLGDAGTLEVSEDGISVNSGDKEDTGEEDVVKEDEPGEEDATGEEGITKEDPVDEEEAPEDDKAEDKGKSGTFSGSASCGEFIEDPKGNDRLVKALAKLAPPNFPLADCTLMGTTKEGYSTTYEAVTVSSNFKVEGYWADVYDEYVEYMEEAGFGPLDKKEDAQAKYARVSGKNADYDLDLSFTQHDAEDGTEYVKIELGLYHYDTPREE